MKIRTIILAVTGVVAIVFIALLLFTPNILTKQKAESKSVFTVIEMDRAGEYGYAVINYNEVSNIRFMSYQNEPLRKIIILNDSGGLAMAGFSEFVAKVRELEKYCYQVEVKNTKYLAGNSLMIVPTGAMPSYILDDLTHNLSSTVILYIGKSDLVSTTDGTKQQKWLTMLSEEQSKRIIHKDTTLDEIIDSNMSTFFTEIIENSWDMLNKTTYVFSGSGERTITVYLGNATATRLIYETHDGTMAFIDSKTLPKLSNIIMPENESIFPWQKTKVSFMLQKTNGTAIMKIYCNAKKIEEKQLQRVMDKNAFLEIIEFSTPGTYVVKVDDNSGTIASGVVHVKNLKIEYLYSAGTAYYFNATVDGKPVESEKVFVSLNNSTTKKNFYVSNGMLVVHAQLQKGANTFNIDIFGTVIKVPVAYAGDSILDVYVKWGLPGLLLIIIVYFGARMAKRPAYVLRIGESAKEIRKEVGVTLLQALEAFKTIREDIGIGKSPITAQEYAISLKKYVTDGAEVTEGNVEELLKALMKKGCLTNYKRYFQLKGEGDARKNAMTREIREALIESGTEFSFKKDRFITKDFEIGFYGSDFKRKALIVIEGKQELREIFSGLSEKERAYLRLQEFNGLIEFVPLSKLGERL